MATRDSTGSPQPAHDGAPTRGITHIGLTVPDLERAVAWYCDVLGWTLMMGPVDVRLEDSHIGRQVRDVFGEGIGEFRQAHMAAGNGVAVELFQFVEPATPQEGPEFSYWKPGVFHLCVVATDIDALAQRIAASGGRMRTSKVWDVFPNKPFKMCYCEDPFGNVIELYSHTHEQVFADRISY